MYKSGSSVHTTLDGSENPTSLPQATVTGIALRTGGTGLCPACPCGEKEIVMNNQNNQNQQQNKNNQNQQQNQNQQNQQQNKNQQNNQR